jgi:hypothetical protein
MNKTFDLTTPFIVNTGTVQNQGIDPIPNNFESYIGKIKKSVDSCRTQFGMAREFCSYLGREYESCKHPNNTALHADTYCKLENCPFLKSTS